MRHRGFIPRLGFSEKEPGTGREDTTNGCAWRKHRDPRTPYQQPQGKPRALAVAISSTQHVTCLGYDFLGVQSALVTAVSPSRASQIFEEHSHLPAQSLASPECHFWGLSSGIGVSNQQSGGQG